MTRLVLVLLAVLSACGRGPTIGEREIAEELRALRTSMRGQERQPAGAGELVGQALSPLRDVLQQMVADQRQLNARQGVLADEMRGWTRLLAESARQDQADAAAELDRRLAQLGEQISAQEQRQREMEDLLGGALLRTADKLEEFLRRVGVEPSTGAAPAAAAGDGTQSPPKEVEAADPPPQTPASEQERQGSLRWLWWLLAATSMVTGLWLMHRRRDEATLRVADEVQISDEAELLAAFDEVRSAPEPAALAELPSTPVARVSTAAEPAPPEVDQLWSAAALLGEAIGKLKRNGADAVPSADEPVHADSAPHEATDRVAETDLQFAETAAVDPGRTAPDEVWGGVDVAPPEPAPRKRRVATLDAVTVTLPLASHDGAAAERCARELLENDPRVLVSPSPKVEAGGQGLTVRFALLPGLPAAERSSVEQRLRDAIA